MTKLRLVLDTNTLISGLLVQPSMPQQAFDYATSQAILLMSKATQAELERVLIRPKFARYVSLEKRLKFIASLTARSEQVEITQRLEICRDPKDDKFLELAICGSATHLITGDDDLLVLNPFRNVEILKSSDFVSNYS
jgi:putative PIN family toxin of toxin-antitoxin system